MSDKPSRSDSSEGKPRRAPRFKGGPDDVTVDSLIVDASELDMAYHHVDELGGEKLEDHVSFRSGSRDETEMDMTPMVDVTFLLLIFFMVTAAFSLQRSLQVPTPRPEEPSKNVQQRDPSEDSNIVTVHVDENNTFRVVTTDWDVEAPSKHELLIKLREARAGNTRGERPSRLLVMANVDAAHRAVVAAMDAGSQVDMQEIQLLMVEENQW
jgi:biopolymer transport protein ExbD